MSLIKDILRKDAVVSVLSFLAYLVVRFMQFASITEYRGVGKLKDYMDGGRRPVVVVFWHSRGLFMTKIWRKKLGMGRYPVAGIFSTHADGRIIGGVYRMFGVENIMSAKRSALSAKDVAFKSIRMLREGVSVGFTPDGPLGPAMRFLTDSVFLFAKAAGAPIVPLYISANRVRFLKTWDRYMVIKPFSRSVIEVGDLVFVDRGLRGEALARLKKGLEKTMVEKTLALDAEMGIEQGFRPVR